MPYPDVPTLTPGVRSYTKTSRSDPPMWVSCLRHAVPHGSSCVAHSWPVLAAPSERWPLMCPTAPLPHTLWSPGSGHAASKGGVPCFGAIMLSFDPARVHAG